ncbi:MAG: hypothetical protein KAT04_15200 [Methylococcales bacterium]|nr:hypothetical protein [Methylococcales bacterium]
MDNSELEIDSWLSQGLSVIEDKPIINDAWESGFEVDRQIVISSLGGYRKTFLRPERFVKRFYHTVYPLPIDEWQCSHQIKLYEGFCTIDVVLDIRFQATLKYALRNTEILTGLNEHIKTTFHGLVIDIVNKEMLNLSENWVKNGLLTIEKLISISVSEMLMVQNIQSQVFCKLKTSFDDFPDVKLSKENVYLSVLKKDFEFNEQQKQEKLRQQQETDKQLIELKLKELKHINNLAELDRQRQAAEAKNKLKLMEEQEQQLAEEFVIEQRSNMQKLEHDTSLKDMVIAAEIQENENKQVHLRESEEREKIKIIAHQTKIKKAEFEAEIAEYESEQERWRATKKKNHAEELALKHRQNQLEFETELNDKKQFEQERLTMQEQSFSVREKSDVYLKREIEILELEKKRLALQMSIKNDKEKAVNQAD